MNHRYLRAVDESRFDVARKRMHMMLSGEIDFNLAWLRGQGWVVAPVMWDEETHRGMEAQAIQDLGVQTGLGMPTSPNITKAVCPAWEFRVSEEALEELADDYAGLQYLVSSFDAKFGILVTDEYTLYAGPCSFVEQVIGEPIERAYDKFVDQPDTPLGSFGSIRAFAKRVAERYRGFR